MRQGIKEKDIRDFESAVKRLEKVMDRIRSYKPEAMAFLDNGDAFQLISDSWEYDELCNRNHYVEASDLIVESVGVLGFGAGAMQ